MKKIVLNLINNERKQVNIKAQKACASYQLDKCEAYDYTQCSGSATDICYYDYASCTGSAKDKCYTDTDYCSYGSDIL